MRDKHVILLLLFKTCLVWKGSFRLCAAWFSNKEAERFGDFKLKVWAAATSKRLYETEIGSYQPHPTQNRKNHQTPLKKTRKHHDKTDNKQNRRQTKGHMNCTPPNARANPPTAATCANARSWLRSKRRLNRRPASGRSIFSTSTSLHHDV